MGDPTPAPGAPGIGELRFLYVGVDDTESAVAAWVDGLGARLRWRFRAFGADVAGVALGSGPLVLLADHRPTGTVLPVWAVASLEDATAGLGRAGWQTAQPLGTPEGDAVVLRRPGGPEIALLEVVRPGAMDTAHADASNPHRVV